MFGEKDLILHKKSPRPFFCRQGRHSVSHISGMPLLPPLLFILQNPGKT
jgi:hypothetical protein